MKQKLTGLKGEFSNPTIIDEDNIFSVTIGTSKKLWLTAYE